MNNIFSALCWLLPVTLIWTLMNEYLWIFACMLQVLSLKYLDVTSLNICLATNSMYLYSTAFVNCNYLTLSCILYVLKDDCLSLCLSSLLESIFYHQCFKPWLFESIFNTMIFVHISCVNCSFISNIVRSIFSITTIGIV